MVWIAREGRDAAGGWQGRWWAAKFRRPGGSNGMAAELGAETGDVLLLVADAQRLNASVVLGRLRNEMGRRLGLIDDSVLAFAWVIDPPLIEWSAAENRWDAGQQMFTMPRP